jgi:3-phosphoshikimate 1-carboxyvinyltransferase
MDVPGDKSISHRALMLASIATGPGRIRGLLRSQDTLGTLAMMQALGTVIHDGSHDELRVEGRGLHGLREPRNVIDAGNSGTTIRIGSGLLAGQPFLSVVTGDDSLRSRPMERVVKPLQSMGAAVNGREDGRLAPLVFMGGHLSGLRHESSVASAQVKSALLLAGLRARDAVTVVEPAASRDHTERMLSAMGAPILVRGNEVTLQPAERLEPIDITVPGDFSSAAFFLALASMVPGSRLLIRNVGVNPLRSGLLAVLARMGATVDLEDPRQPFGEPVADLVANGPGQLSGVSVEPDEIPSLIDEVPVLCAAAALATGRTRILGAGELRVKESDRIRTMANALNALGVECGEFPDGMWIEGPATLRSGVRCETAGDHRIAMALMVLSAATGVSIELSETGSIATSFPGFSGLLRSLT